MRLLVGKGIGLLGVAAAMLAVAGMGLSEQGQEDFEAVRKRMEAAKPAIQKRQADLLARALRPRRPRRQGRRPCRAASRSRSARAPGCPAA